MSSVFALVDCNNFFASCERVFHPSLRNRPVCVLSNNDGCVVARSNEVKRLGVPMGAPLFKYRDFFQRHHVSVFSSNFSLYGDLSNRVISILSRNCPDIEVYSIDEAFLDYSDFSVRHIERHARMLRSRILQWVGIPVSIGIGTTKTLAKLANEIAKHDEEFCGVLDISSKPFLDSFLRRVSIGDVWGVGRRLAPVLRTYNIYTALDLKNASAEWIHKRFSIMLKRTVLELRGISCIPFGEESAFQDTIMSSRSFGKAVLSFHDLFEALSQYISIATEKLRRQRAAASYLYVFIRTNIHKKDDNFYANGVGVGLPSPTAYSPVFIHYARELLRTLYRPSLCYKKAGVVLSSIVPDRRLQMNLFGDLHYTTQQRCAMGALDTVNNEFGSDTVLFASSGIQRGWSGKRNLRSPRFTTQWNELLCVSL